MSNETKRDVLDEVRYKFRNFKNEHRHGMYASPDSIDHYLSDALKRYVAALPDETDNQKSCPYCHEADPQSKHAHYGKAMSDKTEYFDFVRKTKLYRRVRARIKSPEDQHPKLCVTQMNRFREVSVVLDKAINYCPICGRKL